MKTLIRKGFSAIAVAIGFVTAAAGAATPVAVFEGEKLADGTSVGGYALTLGTGNTYANGVITIGNEATTGVKINFPSAMTAGMTVLFKYSDLTLDTTARTIATSSITQSGSDDRTGVYVYYNNTVGLPDGIWNTTGTYRDGATANTMTDQQLSGTFAFTYKANDGTYLYRIADGARATIFGCAKLHSRDDGNIYGCAVGGGRNTDASHKQTPAKGMKISAIAVFSGVLGEADMNAYKFPSEMTEYAATAAGTCNWTGLSWSPDWPAGGRDVAVANLTVGSGGATLTIDANEQMSKMNVTSAAGDALTLKDAGKLTVSTCDFSSAAGGVRIDCTGLSAGEQTILTATITGADKISGVNEPSGYKVAADATGIYLCRADNLTRKNPVTDADVTFTHAFVGTTDGAWDKVANWRTVSNGALMPYAGSLAPGLRGTGANYQPGIFDGNLMSLSETEGYKCVTATAQVDGWIANFGFFNKAKVTVADLYGITSNGDPCNYYVDSSSKLIVTSGPATSYSANRTANFYVAAANGVDFTAYHGISTITHNYYLKGLGSVKYAAGVTAGTHTIKRFQLVMGSGANKIVKRQQLISFAANDNTPVFTVANDATVSSDDETEVTKLDAAPTLSSPYGAYFTEQTSDGVYVTFVGRSEQATLTWDNDTSGWKDAEGQPATPGLNSILALKDNDVVTFGSAVAPYAVTMPKSGTVTINNQNNLTIAAIDIPSGATLVLGSNAVPGFGVTGTGTLKYGVGKGTEANEVTVAQLANFNGTFWMTTGRHEYNTTTPIATTVTLKVTDGAQLFLQAGSATTWNNKFVLAGSGWKNDGNDVEHAAMRPHDNITLGENCEIIFVTEGDKRGSIGCTGTTTMNGTLKGDGFEKRGSGTMILTSPKTQVAGLSGSVVVACGTLRYGNSNYNENIDYNLGTGVTVESGATFLVHLCQYGSETIDEEGKPHFETPIILNGGALNKYDGSVVYASIDVQADSSLKAGDWGKRDIIRSLSGANKLTLTADGAADVAVFGGDFTGTLLSNSANITLRPQGNALKDATAQMDNGKIVTDDTTVVKLIKMGRNDCLKDNAATVNTGTTLDINGTDNTANAITLAGGKLVNNGGGTSYSHIQTPTIAVTANSEIGGTGLFSMIASSYNATALQLNANTLTKTGANTFSLITTTVSGEGTLSINEGTVCIKSGYGNNTTCNDGTFALNGGTLSVESGKTLSLKGLTVNSGTLSNAGTINNLAVLNGTVDFNNFGSGSVGFADAVTIASGTTTLNAATATALADKTVTVASGATLDLNGQVLTGVKLLGSGTVTDSAATKGSIGFADATAFSGTIGAGITLNVTAGQVQLIGATITGGNTINRSGSGAVVVDRRQNVNIVETTSTSSTIALYLTTSEYFLGGFETQVNCNKSTGAIYLVQYGTMTYPIGDVAFTEDGRFRVDATPAVWNKGAVQGNWFDGNAWTVGTGVNEVEVTWVDGSTASATITDGANISITQDVTPSSVTLQGTAFINGHSHLKGADKNLAIPSGKYLYLLENAQFGGTVSGSGSLIVQVAESDVVADILTTESMSAFSGNTYLYGAVYPFTSDFGKPVHVGNDAQLYLTADATWNVATSLGGAGAEVDGSGVTAQMRLGSVTFGSGASVSIAANAANPAVWVDEDSVADMSACTFKALGGLAKVGGGTLVVKRDSITEAYANGALTVAAGTFQVGNGSVALAAGTEVTLADSVSVSAGAKLSLNVEMPESKANNLIVKPAIAAFGTVEASNATYELYSLVANPGSSLVAKGATADMTLTFGGDAAQTFSNLSVNQGTVDLAERRNVQFASLAGTGVINATLTDAETGGSETSLTLFTCASKANTVKVFVTDSQSRLYEVTENAGTYTVNPTNPMKFAKIVETAAEYTSVAGAIAAVSAGQKIQLLRDCNEALTTGKTFTFDYNGHAFNGTLAIEAGGVVTVAGNIDNAKHRYLLANTTGAGTLQMNVSGNVELQIHSDTTAHTANVNVNYLGTGEIHFVGTDRGDVDKYTVSAGKTVTFENGTIWAKRSVFEVYGNLIAKAIKLGHEAEGAYTGKVTVYDGAVVKAGSVTFANKGGSSALDIRTGGVFEFTQNDTSAIALMAADKSYSVLLKGGTLKADASSWHVDGGIALTAVADTTTTLYAAEGKTLKLSGAIAGTGSLIAEGAGIVTLPASDVPVTVRNGTTFKVILTVQQCIDGYTANNVTFESGSGTITFVKPDGTEVAGVEGGKVFKPTIPAGLLRYGFAFNDSRNKEEEASETLAFSGSSTYEAGVNVPEKALQFTSGQNYGGGFGFGGGDFTVVAVVKAPTTENTCIFGLGGQQNTTGMLGMRRATGNNIALFTKGGTDLLTVEVADATTKYHTYAIRYNSATQELALSVDFGAFGDEVDFTCSTAEQFQFGGVHGGPPTGAANANNGAIDEFRLYTARLSVECLKQAVPPFYPSYEATIPAGATGTLDMSKLNWYPAVSTLYNNKSWSINNQADGVTMNVDASVTATRLTVSSAAGKELTLSKGNDVTVSVEAYDFSGANGKVTFAYDPGVLVTAPHIRYDFDVGTKDVNAVIGQTGVYEFKAATINGFVKNTPTVRVVEGDAVTLKNGSTTTVNTSQRFDVTGGELYLGAANNGAIWYGDGTTSAISGGKVIARATGTGQSGSGSGLLLGFSGGCTLDISGTGELNVENSSLNFWSTTVINMTGGKVKAKGAFKGSTAGGTVNVGSGAVFELGSLGWKSGTGTFNLNGGTLKSFEDGAAFNDPIALGAASTIEVPASQTLTLKAGATGANALTKTGEGTFATPTLGTVTDFTLSAGSVKLLLTEAQGVSAEAFAVFASSQEASAFEGNLTAVNPRGTTVPGIITKDDGAIMFRPDIDLFTRTVAADAEIVWADNGWTKDGESGVPCTPGVGRVGAAVLTFQGNATVKLPATTTSLAAVRFVKDAGAASATVTLDLATPDPLPAQGASVVVGVPFVAPDLDGVTLAYTMSTLGSGYLAILEGDKIVVVKKSNSISMKTGTRTDTTGKIGATDDCVGGFPIQGRLWNHTRNWDKNAGNPYSDIVTLKDGNNVDTTMTLAFYAPNTYFNGDANPQATGNGKLTKTYFDDADTSKDTQFVATNASDSSVQITMPAAPNNRGWQIQMDHIPYEMYDLYIYPASDVAMGNLKACAMAISVDGVNWQYYAGDATQHRTIASQDGSYWAADSYCDDPAMTEGVNYIKIRVSKAAFNATDVSTLHVTHGTRNTGSNVRLGLAGIQVVEVDRDGVYTRNATGENTAWSARQWTTTCNAESRWDDATDADPSYAFIDSGVASEIELDANVKATMVTLTGDEVFTFAGSHTLDAPVNAQNFAGGRIVLEAPITGTITLPEGVAVDFNVDEGESALAYSYSFNGNGTISKTGLGTLFMTNNLASAIAITEGTLAMSNATLTVSQAIASGATLRFHVDAGKSVACSTVLSGAGRVVKTGAGTLTLSGANTFTGGADIAEGTVVLGNDSALGPGRTDVRNGATIDMGGKKPTNEIYLAGDGVDGKGALVTSAQMGNSIGTRIRLAADASWGGSFYYHFGKASDVQLKGFTFTKRGSNRFPLSNTTIDGPGKIVVAEGAFENNNGNNNLSEVDLVIAADAELDMSKGTSLTVSNFTCNGTITGSAAKLVAKMGVNATAAATIGKIEFADGATLTGSGLTVTNTLTLGNSLNVAIDGATHGTKVMNVPAGMPNPTTKVAVNGVSGYTLVNDNGTLKLYNPAPTVFTVAGIAPTAQTNFNGSVVVATYSAFSKGDYDAVEFKLTVDGHSYVGVQDEGNKTVTFFVPGDVAAASNVYAGAVTATGKGTIKGAGDECVAYDNTAWLYQGAPVAGTTPTGWFKTWAEGTEVLKTDGAWTVGGVAKDPAAVASKIIIDADETTDEYVDYVFTPDEAAERGQAVVVDMDVSFDAAFDVTNFVGAQAAICVVADANDAGAYRFAAFADGVWKTNTEWVAYLGATYPVRLTLNYRQVPATATYEVLTNGVYETIANGVSGTTKSALESITFNGAGTLAVMTGSNVVDTADASLVEDGAQHKYANVDEAFRAVGATDLKLLWDASWDPSAMLAGNWSILANGHKLYTATEGVKIDFDGTTYAVTGDYFEAMTFWISDNAVHTNMYTYLTNALVKSPAAATNLMLRSVALDEAFALDKSVVLMGDTNELTGAGFTVGAGHKLTIASGYIGVLGVDGALWLTGGKYKDTDWSEAVSNGYHMAKLAIAEGDYKYQVIVGEEAKAGGEVLLPVAATGEVVPSGSISFSTNALVDAGIATEEEIRTKPGVVAARLDEQGANHNKKWENLVLGLSNTDENSKPVMTPVQSSNPDVVTLKPTGIVVDKSSGATVTYRVHMSDKPGGKVANPEQAGSYENEIKMPLPTSGVKYYMIEVLTIPAR